MAKPAEAAANVGTSGPASSGTLSSLIICQLKSPPNSNAPSDSAYTTTAKNRVCGRCWRRANTYTSPASSDHSATVAACSKASGTARVANTSESAAKAWRNSGKSRLPVNTPASRAYTAAKPSAAPAAQWPPSGSIWFCSTNADTAEPNSSVPSIAPMVMPWRTRLSISSSNPALSGTAASSASSRRCSA